MSEGLVAPLDATETSLAFNNGVISKSLSGQISWMQVQFKPKRKLEHTFYYKLFIEGENVVVGFAYPLSVLQPCVNSFTERYRGSRILVIHPPQFDGSVMLAPIRESPCGLHEKIQISLFPFELIRVVGQCVCWKRLHDGSYVKYEGEKYVAIFSYDAMTERVSLRIFFCQSRWSEDMFLTQV